MRGEKKKRSPGTKKSGNGKKQARVMKEIV
jgi:hypothetical protein